MTQVLNNQTINNNQGGANMNEKELKDAVIALQTLVQANKDQYVDLIKRAYDTSVKPLVQTSNVAGVVNIKGLDFAVNTDGDVVLKKDELENLFNTVLAATQQTSTVEQPVVNAQPQVQTPEQQERIKVLADEMTKMEIKVRNYAAAGMACSYEVAMYNRYKAEFDSLVGNGIVNTALNTAQTVANSVSNYTANTIAPTVGSLGNDVSDLITGFLKGVTQLGKDVWNETAPVVSAGVNAGFNIADKGITFTGQQLNNGINVAQNQIVNLSQLGRI